MKPLPLPPLETIREILDYDQDTGIFRWKKRKDKGPKWNAKHVGEVAGCYMSKGYKTISVSLSFKTHRCLAHRLAYYYVTGEQPECVDHINGVKDDNRFSNLRAATKSQNSMNMKSKGGKSKYKGVSLHGCGKWVAYIRAEGKQRYLGLFSTEEEAHSARLAAGEKYHGQFHTP